MGLGPVEGRTPEQYQEVIRQFLMAYWARRIWEIEQTVLGVQVGLVAPETLYNSALADQLAEIARLAAGEMDVETAIALGVMEGIQDLCERLFAAPGLGYSYQVSAWFWETPLGAIVGKAHFRIRGDELITITEAAGILGVGLSAMSNRIDRGDIQAYRAPDEPNPQRSRRVLRSQVEGLVEGRSGPSDLKRVRRGDEDVRCVECGEMVDPGSSWQPGVRPP